MRFTVVWQPTAEQKLAELWTTASDREAVAKAADEIDFLLHSLPLSVGESRAPPTRILLLPPLAVYYDVLEDQLVSVWAVWRRDAPS